MKSFYEIEKPIWVRVFTDIEKDDADAFINSRRLSGQQSIPHFSRIYIYEGQQRRIRQLHGIWPSSFYYELSERYGADNVQMNDTDIPEEIERVSEAVKDIESSFRQYEMISTSIEYIKAARSCNTITALCIIAVNALISISESMSIIVKDMNNHSARDRKAELH